MLDTIKRRRSVRNYLEKQINEEELNIILEAALYSPSGHNAQPWFFTVIQNKELIDYISDRTKRIMTMSNVDKARKLGESPKYHLFHQAPTVVIVSGRTGEKSVIDLPGYNFEPYSPLAECSASIQNMLLAAESIGVGSCWIGFVNYFFAFPDEVQKLGIPENFKPLFAVCLGYKNNSISLNLPQRKTDCINYIR